MADTGDRILCHACGRVWPRSSQHGLECPHCSSDFTEIIEIPPDTDLQPSSPPDPPISVPEERSPSPPHVNPWADHDPWADQDDDFDENSGWDTLPGNGFTRRTYRSPNGRFTFSTTTYTHGFPSRRAPGTQQREAPMHPLIPMVRGLDTLFQTIAQNNRHQYGYDATAGGSADAPRTFDDMDLPPHSGTRPPNYSPTGGLHPRDADGPQPMGNPLRTLGDILELFQADVGNNGNGGAAGGGGPGVRVMAGPTPLALLSALLNLERNGDAVYSQEELDRVISQLVEQNGGRTAIPPASPDAIRALPKKKVDSEMLGSEGKAECSICMDTAELGSEVTLLPCQHWFHEPCIEMWLNQHNTCPHCRRSIDPTATAPNATPSAPSERRTSGQQNRRSVSSQTTTNTRQPSWNSLDEDQEPSSQHSPRAGRGEGFGGWTGWVRNRFGGGS